jgi:hypothetical protein
MLFRSTTEVLEFCREATPERMQEALERGPMAGTPMFEAQKASLLEYLAERSFIVQLYARSPILYEGRKCDFRQYLMFGCTSSGRFYSYFHSWGHGRVSAKQYDEENLSDKEIHATNLNIDTAGGGYKSQDTLALGLAAGNAEVRRRMGDWHVGLERNCADAAKWFLSPTGWLAIVRPLLEGLTEMYQAKLTNLAKKKPLAAPQMFLVAVDYLVDSALEKAHLCEDQTNPAVEPCLGANGGAAYKMTPTLFKEATELLDLIEESNSEETLFGTTADYYTPPVFPAVQTPTPGGGWIQLVLTPEGEVPVHC